MTLELVHDSVTITLEQKSIRDVAKVFNRRESCNDRRVFGPKARSSMFLAR